LFLLVDYRICNRLQANASSHITVGKNNTKADFSRNKQKIHILKIRNIPVTFAGLLVLEHE